MRSARGELGEVLHERGREVVPREHLERGGHHEGGRLRQPLEEREDARADVAPVQSGTARRGAREDVEVVGLGVGEPQRARDPGEDLARRARRPALLEPDVVLRGDVREDRDLLAAQTRCPASRPGGEADVLRPEPLATAAEERPELLLVHTPSLHAARRRILVPPVPASGPAAGLTTVVMTNNTDIAPIGLLTGKVVFITGASRGIGAAAARLFAAEGAAVVLAARSTDALERIVTEIRADGGVADAVTLDLADRASIRAAVDRVEELHGRLDGAFNNGAAIQQPGPLDTTSDEDIDEQFAVNFRAHWTAMTAEAALMRRNGGGAIVNTSSIGSRRANPALPAYGAMKRALNSITETAAVTWAPQGIRVNGITPGGTATEMIDAWEAATPGHHRAHQRGDPARPHGRAPRGRRGGRVAAQRPGLDGDRRDRAGRRRRRRLTSSGWGHSAGVRTPATCRTRSRTSSTSPLPSTSRTRPRSPYRLIRGTVWSA